MSVPLPCRHQIPDGDAQDRCCTGLLECFVSQSPPPFSQMWLEVATGLRCHRRGEQGWQLGERITET